MQLRGHSLLIVPLLVSSLFLAGCPKKPATSGVAAPPPTSGPVVVAPPAPAPAPAPTPAPAPAPAPATAAPAATPPPPSQFSENPNLKDIFFDFDKYDVRPVDTKTLDANASWLKQNATHLILIEGHCDERGTNEYNLALGERRAKSTMNYLVAQGIQASRITIISYGEERPQCSDKSEDCWAKNRRSHFLVKVR